MENVIIIAILVVLIWFGIRSSIKHFKGEGGCCGGGNTTVKAKRKKLKKVIAQKTVTIEGMTCEHCKNRVERSINELDGVAAKVSLKNKEAVVFMEKEISDEQFRTVIEKAGYKVSEIKQR